MIVNTRIKKEGQVYTPDRMVTLILDSCNYSGPAILTRHVMDNSCGEGAFLVEVTRRYIMAARDRHMPHLLLATHLAKYIHGIEKDPEAHARCIHNLDRIAQEYGLHAIRWDVCLADALTVSDYDGQMDWVVGNPPYVRIQNCDLSNPVYQQYTFIGQGNFDLYLAFFELGFRMLSPKGQLCYITPVSWIYSKSGRTLRDYVQAQRILAEVIDMQHYQVFTGITSYTIISRFCNNQPYHEIGYYHFDPDTYQKILVSRLSPVDVLIDGRFYFGTSDEIRQMHQVRDISHPRHYRVKNGFATLADSLFFNDDIPESPYTIPTLKVSKSRWYKGFFLYDHEGKPITVEEFRSYTPLVNYFERIKHKLLQRDFRDKEWWLYGRSQAVNDVYRHRVAVNSLIRDSKDVRIHRLQPGEGVYNGFYVLSDDIPSLDDITPILQSETFIKFVRMLRIYKNNGYYEFRAKDLEQFLNYQYNKYNE